MTITKKQLTDKIFDILLKQPTQSGVITEARIGHMLNDSIDWFCSKASSFTASFFLKEATIVGVASNREITLPNDVAVIQNVKFKGTADTWTPLNYGEINEVPEGSNDGHMSGNIFYFMNNKIIIYPTPSIAYAVKIQYTAYPAELALDADLLSSEFNRCLINAIKWRTAYQCWCLLNDSNANAPWMNQVMEWQEMAIKHLQKRKSDFGVVQGYTDY